MVSVTGPLLARRLTPPGRGAVASILITGSGALIAEVGIPFQSASGRPWEHADVGRIQYGRWGQAPAEEVVLCWTSPNAVEIHCHGGEAAVQRILSDLAANGVPAGVARPGQTLDGRWLEAECLEAAALARTERTAAIAIRQANGVLREALERITSNGAPGRSSLQATLRDLDALLRRAPIGRHVTTPWNVVIAGRPNVGKSSLMNAIVGYGRSIVFDQPGTTRDIVTAETAVAGWPVLLADTAGLRLTGDALEAEGVARAVTTAEGADLVVLVFDASVPLTEEDRRLQQEWPAALRVANKADLESKDFDVGDAIRTCCLTEEGIAALCEAIGARLVPQPPSPDEAIPITQPIFDRLERCRRLAIAGDEAAVHEAIRSLLESRRPDGDSAESSGG